MIFQGSLQDATTTERASRGRSETQIEVNIQREGSFVGLNRNEEKRGLERNPKAHLALHLADDFYLRGELVLEDAVLLKRRARVL